MPNKKPITFILCLMLACGLACGCINATPGQVQAQPRTTAYLHLVEEEGTPAQQLTQLPEEEAAASPEPEALSPEEPEASSVPKATNTPVDRDGAYTAKEDVALYLHIYGELPQNFITKKEAQQLGWSGGGLDGYAYGKCIGGSYFGNYEGLLPEKKGRSYYECDIDTLHKSSRGPKRVVYSNDGLIYYTGDHYESFTLLYGEE